MSMPLNEFAAVGYQLLQEIGRGGMGRVFRAREIALDRIVALKLLGAGVDTAGGAGQLLREARNAAALDHPHIVPIYGVGTAGSMPFIAMKYIAGPSVEQLAANGPLPLASVLELLDAAAAALDAAHDKGIVHLDIKPANLLLDEHGWLYVSDFGLARASNATISLARSDHYVTPDYVAPEQVRGLPPAPANDIYALGVVAYELLTGQLPFSTGSAIAALGARLTDDPIPPRRVRLDMPPAVEQVLLRVLSRDPTLRHASAGAFAADLRRAAARWPARPPRAPALLPSQQPAALPSPPPTIQRARQQTQQPVPVSIARPLPEDSIAARRPATFALLLERYRARVWVPIVTLALAALLIFATYRPQPPLSGIEALLAHGDQALIDGQPNDALARYQEADSAYPSSPLPEQRLARFFLLREDFASAEQAAQEALSDQPRDAVSLALLAEAQAGQHLFDAALQSAEQAQRLDQGTADGDRALALVLAERAVRRSDARLFDQARQAAARAAATQHGNTPDAAIERARAIAAQGFVELRRFEMSAADGDGAQAARLFESASGLQVHMAAFHVQRGLVYAEQAGLRRRLGDTFGADAAGEAAAAELRFALEIEPASAPAYTGLGLLALGQADYTNAARYFDEALAADPSYDAATRGKARAFVLRSDPDTAGAVAILQAAATARPDSRTTTALGWALLNQAFEHDREGDNGNAYLLAEEQFRAALAVDDGSIDALNGLGWALRARGLSSGKHALYAEAEQVLQRSLHANARHPDALFGIGWVAFAREQYGDAVQYFEQAVIQSPLDHTPRFWLGLALEHMGRAPEARIALREARRLGSPFASEALARLGE